MRIRLILFKQYFVLRGVVHQLKNRNKKLSLLVIYQKFNSNKIISSISLIFFIILWTAFFLFSDPFQYKIFTIIFLSVTFMNLADWIFFMVITYKIEQLLYKEEEEFSNNVYSSDDNFLLETVFTFSEYVKEKK